MPELIPLALSETLQWMRSQKPVRHASGTVVLVPGEDWARLLASLELAVEPQKNNPKLADAIRRQLKARDGDFDDYGKEFGTISYDGEDHHLNQRAEEACMDDEYLIIDTFLGLDPNRLEGSK